VIVVIFWKIIFHKVV